MKNWLGILLIGALVGFVMDVEPLRAQEGENAAAETAAPADAAAPTDAAPATEPAVDNSPNAIAGRLAELSSYVDWFWTCVAAFLVFFMQMGFACVESGLTRAKNAVNIMMKNLMDFSIGSIAFWAIGFGLMFGASNGFCGSDEFFLNPDAIGTEGPAKNIYGKAPNQTYTFLIFQTVFAATAATIVSGAMAERTKFVGYLIYSALISLFIYPISGSWAWGTLWNGCGWLEANGFMTKQGFAAYVDFAGSSVVHLCGGAAALAGAIALGPRKGKFNADGTPNAIPGHNLPMATLGVFVLWLGWFGFNPGSTAAMAGGSFARIAVVTNLAACAGALTGMFTAWAKFGKPDITMTLNGALGGLVAITAGCNTMTIAGSLIVGAIAGALVVLSVLFFDKIKVDDPVGAVSVHGVCGAFGTICCGVPFFCMPGAAGSLVTQTAGVVAIAAWSFIMASIVFALIKATIGLRVSEKEELEGLDLPEHGNEAYHGFVFQGGSHS
jgi:ammonium transporter, Amt family